MNDFNPLSGSLKNGTGQPADRSAPLGFSAPPLLFGLLLLVLVLSGGCTAARVEPRQDLSDHLPLAWGNIRAGDEPVILTWEHSFPCSRLLADLKGLEHRNYTLAAARGRAEQTAAQYGLAAASLGPSPLSLGTEFQQERETEDDGGVTHTDTYTLSAGFGWEADIWGRLQAKKKAAALLVEEQEALARQTLLELQARLVMHWIRHQAARRLEQLVSSRQEKNRQMLELTRLEAGLGLGTRLDLLRQSRRLAALEQSAAAIQGDRQTSANAYEILMGRPPSGKNLPAGTLPGLTPLSSLPGPGQLLSQRPDLKAAFAGLRAADHEVAAAVADRLPRIAFGFSFELSGKTPAAVGDDSALSLLANLLTPVFDAGRKALAVKQQKARTQTALALLHQTLLDALLEVEDAVVSEHSLFSKLRLLDRELKFAGQAADEAMFRYVHGQEKFLSVLTADLSLDRLEQEKVGCQRALLLNRARLLRAVGVTLPARSFEQGTKS